AALDAEGARVLGDGEELLLHRERDFYRLFGYQRQNTDQRLELDVELRAEAAAEERHAHADPVLGPAEQPRDLHAHERRALGRRMDRERALGRFGRRDQRLERRVHHLLGAEAVLEDVLGLRESGGRVAAAQVKVERYVRLCPALEVLQIGEGTDERSARLSP